MERFIDTDCMRHFYSKVQYNNLNLIYSRCVRYEVHSSIKYRRVELKSNEMVDIFNADLRAYAKSNRNFLL